LTGGVDAMELRRAEPSPATRTPNVPTLPPPEFGTPSRMPAGIVDVGMEMRRAIALILIGGALPGAATPTCRY
jgi:hypothetical protein